MPKSLYIDPVKVREPGYIHFEDIPVCQYNKTIKQELEEGNYTKEDLIRIYRDMAICREFEHMLTLIKTQAPRTCPSVRKLPASAKRTF